MMRKISTAKGIIELLKNHPEASCAEAERFFHTFGRKHASQHLGSYLAWRAEFAPSDTKTESFGAESVDEAYWNYAIARTSQHLASQASEEDELSENATVSTSSHNDTEGHTDASLAPSPSAHTVPRTGKRRSRAESVSTIDLDPFLASNLDLMPRFVCTHKSSETGDFIRDNKGHRVVHAIPAQLDPILPAEAYSLAIGLYLEQLFEDIDGKEEQVTVLLDVRVGLGWPNVPAFQMVSLIRQVSNQLNQLHPNRLHKCVLYPIPRAAIALWRSTLKPFMDSKLRQVIELVPGTGANLKSPPPNDRLAAFVPNRHDLEQLERHRLSRFRYTKHIQRGSESSTRTASTRQSSWYLSA